MNGESGRAAVICALLLSGVLACGSPGRSAPAAPAAPPPPAGAAPAAPAAPAPSAGGQPVAAGKPDLATAPLVHLSAGTVAIASWGGFFVGAHRGYFQEVGLDVDLVNLSNANEGLGPLAQGQLHVGTCPVSVACFNLLQRGAPVKLVAGVTTAGKTEKSTGNSALVVRKEVWDAGVIRGPRDLVWRSVYVQGGPGGAPNLVIARWLLRNGLDPRGVDWTSMPSPDLYLAMQNGAVDVGFLSEPLLSGALKRDFATILASNEEMYPEVQMSTLAYWPGIDDLGPQVGERFMVAYLRATRAYVNAFEYGVDEDAIIDILGQETAIKDPAVYRQMHYPWLDPNGALNRASFEADNELWHDLGLMPNAADLSQVFDDKYRQFAVRYLGEYQPPR
jgi:NitT/TauT family transport system substrate-binding protein